jgi:hypothetical protein
MRGYRCSRAVLGLGPIASLRVQRGPLVSICNGRKSHEQQTRQHRLTSYPTPGATSGSLSVTPHGPNTGFAALRRGDTEASRNSLMSGELWVELRVATSPAGWWYQAGPGTRAFARFHTVSQTPSSILPKHPPAGHQSVHQAGHGTCVRQESFRESGLYLAAVRSPSQDMPAQQTARVTSRRTGKPAACIEPYPSAHTTTLNLVVQPSVDFFSQKAAIPRSSPTDCTTLPCPPSVAVLPLRAAENRPWCPGPYPMMRCLFGPDIDRACAVSQRNGDEPIDPIRGSLQTAQHGRR